MLRKSLIVTLGFLGLFLAGTASGTAPASAGYACGPWNGWCRAYFLYPGWDWGYGWYGHRGHHGDYGHHGHHGHNNWGHSYSHKNWNGGWNKGERNHYR